MVATIIVEKRIHWNGGWKTIPEAVLTEKVMELVRDVYL